jgi:hypothetical protein
LEAYVYGESDKREEPMAVQEEGADEDKEKEIILFRRQGESAVAGKSNCMSM